MALLEGNPGTEKIYTKTLKKPQNGWDAFIEAGVCRRKGFDLGQNSYRMIKVGNALRPHPVLSSM